MLTQSSELQQISHMENNYYKKLKLSFFGLKSFLKLASFKISGKFQKEMNRDNKSAS